MYICIALFINTVSLRHGIYEEGLCDRAFKARSHKRFFSSSFVIWSAIRCLWVISQLAGRTGRTELSPIRSISATKVFCHLLKGRLNDYKSGVYGFIRGCREEIIQVCVIICRKYGQASLGNLEDACMLNLMTSRLLSIGFPCKK